MRCPRPQWRHRRAGLRRGRACRGRPAALVTITSLDGPFSRPLGAQLAVAGDKRFAGSISGGCLEQALTEESQIAMKEGVNRSLRYGTGSPYIDVRLPCGGGIDLYVDAQPDRALLQRAVALGRARKTFSFLFDPLSKRSTLRIEEGRGEGEARRVRAPVRSEASCGAGGAWMEIVAMSQLARTADVEIVVASQEPATLEYCKPYAHELIRLTTPARHRSFQSTRARPLRACSMNTSGKRRCCSTRCAARPSMSAHSVHARRMSGDLRRCAHSARGRTTSQDSRDRSACSHRAIRDRLPCRRSPKSSPFTRARRTRDERRTWHSDEPHRDRASASGLSRSLRPSGQDAGDARRQAACGACGQRRCGPRRAARIAVCPADRKQIGERLIDRFVIAVNKRPQGRPRPFHCRSA